MALKKEPSAEGSDSSVEISEEVTSSQQNILKKAMLSDREMEYQFWENFPSLDSTSKEGNLADQSFDNFLANCLMHRRFKQEFMRYHHRLIEQLLAQTEKAESPRHVTLRSGDGSELLHAGDLLRLRNDIEAASIR